MNDLIKVVNDSGLAPIESKSILEKFGDYEEIAKEWEAKAKAIVVTNVDQTTEMAMAREARKKFSQLRISIEETRKEMKEQSLRKGQAIDSVARFLKSLVEPIEDYLREQEDFVKIQEQKKLEVELAETEKKEEIARIETEKVEKEEQERVRKENESLKKEAEKREEKLKVETEERLRLEREKTAQEKLRLEGKKKADEEKRLLENAKKEAEEKLKDTIKCPYCGKDFVLSAD